MIDQKEPESESKQENTSITKPNKLQRNDRLNKIRGSINVGGVGAFKSARSLKGFFNKENTKDSPGEKISSPRLSESTENLFTEKYITGDTIGQGTSGVVKIVTRKSDNK
eukprot:CAMPEP_0114575166 /NCGR_PEP_ID=MMETSP0125-20121206/71_1 /TAXON_ID=485358 ORGANISM="Aristerostoma sp., Strain ATCC 50986" /NCGR_SAMPLE_ID=MMETSP0125 /ASSEMBLY_ACC=CAM_ASM_000245 /LENGTH=109 /DNA_ID=CAMNT_0001762695 /DNA_START=32 /DNA_END=361 /DNA_ORIENTATION=-